MRYLRSELAGHGNNGLWVIDSSIDRQYSQMFAFAKKYEFAKIVLAMDIPEEVHRQWILAGGDRSFNPVTKYLEMADQRRDEQKLFLSKHKPDITVPYDYDMDSLLEEVSELIRAKVDNSSRS